jgi:anti-sigma factor (TIGR02949 family)
MIHIHSESCQDLKSQLSAFIDGELDDCVCEEIQRHMADCENCRIMVDTLKRTVLLYRESCEQAVPVDVHSRLVMVLDLEASRKENE